MSVHQDLLRQIHHLNPDGLKLLLEFAIMFSGMPTLCRMPADLQPATVERGLSLVPGFSSPHDAKEPDTYFMVNRRVEPTYVSPRLADWLQTTPDEMIADWERFIDGAEELKRVWELWMVAAQTHQPFNYLVRCRTSTGHIAQAFVRVRPWFATRTQEMVGFMGTVHAQCFPVSLSERHVETA